MTKTNEQKAAALLGWLLMPFAVIDIVVLAIGCMSYPWYLATALFAFLYMIPALVIWGLLMVVAYSRRSPLFIRITWGAHMIFNIAASLLWAGNALMSRDATSLYLLGITLPVLIWTTCLFRKTFETH